MKLKSAVVLLGLFGLAACQTAPKADPAPAQPKQPVASTKSVQYLCGAKSNKKVEVTYHFEDQKAVAAEVIYKGKAVSKHQFVRDTEAEDARFVSQDKYVWVADNLDLNTVEQAKGGMLYKQGKKADNIIVKYCGEPKAAN